MEETSIQYINGNTAVSQPVKMMLYQESLHIYDADSGYFIKSVPFASCHLSVTNNKLYVYFDASSTEYCIIPNTAPEFASLREQVSGPKSIFHKLMKMRLAALVGVLGVLIVVAYFVFIQFIPFIGLKLISPEKERDLGKQMFAAFVKEENKDIEKTADAQTFANTLQLSKKYPIKVTVIDNDKTVNAFAMPGGYVVIYTGLLNKMRSKEELTALLGHEVSHINQRHSLRAMLRSLASSLLFSVVISDFSGVSALILENVNTLRSLSYSRSLETEADTEGMNIMMQNNVDVNGMKHLLETLQKAAGDMPSQLSFLSTHPLTRKRIENVQQFISQHPQQNTSTDQNLEELWRRIKEDK
jgi:beta-barrel assembly-enhancing protease